MLPPLPPKSTLRDRWFRPYRWRLWAQFAVLGMFVVLGPLLFTSERLLESGREVLVEHETIDLSDEANLRVNEFREDMAYLARDVRTQVRRPSLTGRKAVEVVLAVSDGLAIPNEPTWDDPKTPREARRRFLHGTAVGVYAYKQSDNGDVVVEASSVAVPTDPGRRTALIACLNDVTRRLTRRGEFNRSGLHFQLPGDNQPGRAILAFAEPRGDQFVAFVLDFSRYVANRQSISPRHYYLLADPTGRVLVNPVEAADPKVSLPDMVGWKYPQFEERSWFDTSVDAETKQRRLAKVLRAGGERLAGVESAGLASLYRKGYFGSMLELTKVLGEEKAKGASARLNQRMWAAITRDPRLRVGEVSPALGYIEVSHPTTDGLKAACEEITMWWREETGDPKVSVRWSAPLECRTFQGQLTPLRVDLNDEDDPAWLMVAASTEELRQDIDDRFGQVFAKWVVPALIVAALLGLILVVTLTHSVNRLAKAASKLDVEDPKPLPLGGPYEVGELARTLQELAGQVQDRDRQLRDRAARYETILRAAGEGVLIASSAGVIEEANKAAGRMFGTKSEGLIGRPVNTLVLNPDDIPDASESDTVVGVLPGSRALEAVQGKRADGSTFWLEMNLKPVPLRDRVVVVCILRDITQRREAEERVRKLNDELDGRVKLRTAELEEANAKLEVALRHAEAAVRAKDTFVATMSHELRQPLHIIIGFTEALKEEAADLGVGSIEPDLNKILSAARHLLDLINDILDMAKISAGKMELSVEKFALTDMVSEVKTLVGPLAAKNGNEFVVDAPSDLGDMTADARRVRQMLINLLSNAFKFTHAGRIDLRVRRVSEQGREWVRFSVADTGRGMTAEQVSRLFQRFYQADSSTTRGAGGTGLGLTITQSFNDLMGGQPIRVTSQQGVGTEFVVMLPLVVESVSQLAPSHTPPVTVTIPVADTDAVQPADGRTVLVVDDDPMVRELMQRFLGKEGFRVLLAATGDEGLKLAREERPCLITLDVAMPGADGWSVLGQLKGDPVTADIPVVMLTIVDDRGRGFALGATEYLTKPIDWQRLGAILRRYLVGRADGVLVIDDDANNREIVRRHLEKDGWAIREAADGEQGLASFAEHRPGLVLLDLMMPVLDGFGFLDELNKRHPGHRVPVVVLTAKELTPADFDRLNGRVARILEKGDLNHLDTLLELIRRTAKR